MKLNSKAESLENLGLLSSNINVLKKLKFERKLKLVQREVTNYKKLVLKEQKEFDRIYPKVFLYMANKCMRYDAKVTRLIDKMYKKLQKDIF
jgi:hypothetical protein